MRRKKIYIATVSKRKRNKNFDCAEEQSQSHNAKMIQLDRQMERKTSKMG